MAQRPDEMYEISVLSQRTVRESGFAREEIMRMNAEVYEELNRAMERQHGSMAVDDTFVNEEVNNPFKVHQKVKPAISQLIGRAWGQHERDRRLVCVSMRRL